MMFDRHSLSREFDRVGVAKLMGCEPPADTGLEGQAPQLRPSTAGGPGSPVARGLDGAEELTDGKRDAKVYPGLDVGPAPIVHA